MRAKAIMYVASNAVLRKVLGDSWKLTREQEYWWECEYLTAERTGTVRKFYEGYPTDDRESFQGSFDNVFGRECVAEFWTQRETKYHVYAVIGHSIEARHEPDPEELDYTAARVPVMYNSHRGRYKWEFVPLKWAEKFDGVDSPMLRTSEDHMGKLFIYHEPEPGYLYSIGVDTSTGIGSDGTVVSVSRMGKTSQEPDVQVAEWRDNKVGHTEAFAWVMAIAAYYSRYMRGNLDVPSDQAVQWKEPYVSVEQVAAVGDTVNISMRALGYTNFHRMRRYDTVAKKNKRINAHKEGWFTFGWSRPILTGHFETLVKNGWFIVNSPYTLYEMDHWEVHLTAATGKAKYEHNIDCTDDGIFASAMAAFCPRDMKGLAERSSKRPRAEDKTKLPKLDFSPSPHGMVVPMSPLYTVNRRTGVR
jgi:hypothetical protein